MTKRNPQQRRSKEKYAALIRTMRRIVDDQVYTTTSTHGIAKRAGVGVGTLYEYFDSKEDLLAALLEHEVEVIWQQLESQIPKWMNRTNADPVESFVGFVVEYASQNKGMVRVMFGQLPDVQIVWRSYLSTNPLNSVYFLPVGNFTRNHFGFGAGLCGIAVCVLISNHKDTKFSFPKQC